VTLKKGSRRCLKATFSVKLPKRIRCRKLITHDPDLHTLNQILNLESNTQELVASYFNGENKAG